MEDNNLFIMDNQCNLKYFFLWTNRKKITGLGNGLVLNTKKVITWFNID